LRRLGRAEDAIAEYETLLADNPLDLGTHLLLAELRHGLGMPAFLSSYDDALQRAPEAAQLPCTKGRLLLKLARFQDARDAFEIALGIAPGDPGALAGLARAREMSGDPSGAHAAHAASIAVRKDADACEAFGAFLLRQRDLPRALAMAQSATELRPESQGAWALLDLCLRGTDNARAEWLQDHRRHVRVFDLAPPDGYADMATFNRDLACWLEQQHMGGYQYLTQTLRGGTQTHEDMFYNGHDLVDRLLPRITQAVQRYIAEMPDDPSHPLSARRRRGFRYAGSWSSQLSSDGFHVNHIHQKGWISSCYYVAVPQAASDMASQAGWLKFGEPPEEFGATFAPCRTVQPLPGRLVLFPSYMWHGTIAFRDPQKRLTIAFDAIPA
jgi:tetratricopeptide (TPR) repeat protein